MTTSEFDGLSFAEFSQKPLQDKFQHLLYGEPTRALRSKLTYIFISELGRYPQKWELETLEARILSGGNALAISFIESQAKLGVSRPEFVQAATQSLWVDVTHTVDYPYNSGIQRVVRKFAESAANQKLNVRFFRLDEKTHQPRSLNESELNRLLNFSKPQSKSDNGSWNLLRQIRVAITTYPKEDLKYLIKKYYVRLRHDFLIPGSRTVPFFERALRLIDGAKVHIKALLRTVRLKKSIPNQANFEKTTELLVFGKNRILLSELTPEDSRVDFYWSAKQIDGLHLAMIVYDLIPIIAPEHCSVVESFVNYTKLFRIVDQTVCISQSVQRDLENFSKMILRETSSPMRNQFLYLGSDFSVSQEHNSKTPQLQDSKNPSTCEILMVGTFEPRKNQLGVLRAAHLLYSRGLKFTLVFAGNPGWRNEEFMFELDQLDPNRNFVRIETRVTDERLSELYQNCSFSVFFSHIEGFGLPIIESLTYKKPVVVSKRGSMGELADLCGGCIQVEPGNISALTETFQKLLQDTRLLDAITSQIKPLPDLNWNHYSRALYNLVAYD